MHKQNIKIGKNHKKVTIITESKEETIEFLAKLWCIYNIATSTPKIAKVLDTKKIEEIATDKLVISFTIEKLTNKTEE